MKLDVRACVRKIAFFGEDVKTRRNRLYQEIYVSSNTKLSVFSKLLQDCKIIGIGGSYFLTLEMPEENFKIFFMLESLDLRGEKDLRVYLLEFLNNKIDKNELIQKITPYVLASKFGRKENVV